MNEKQFNKLILALKKDQQVALKEGIEKYVNGGIRHLTATVVGIEKKMDEHIEGDKKLRDGIVALGKKFGIPVVAGQDSHYLCIDDHDAHNTLLAVNTGGITGKEGTG